MWFDTLTENFDVQIFGYSLYFEIIGTDLLSLTLSQFVTSAHTGAGTGTYCTVKSKTIFLPGHDDEVFMHVRFSRSRVHTAYGVCFFCVGCAGFRGVKIKKAEEAKTKKTPQDSALWPQTFFDNVWQRASSKV